MKKVLECVRLDLKMILQSKLTIICIVGFLIYNYLGLHYLNEELETILTRSAFVIETGMFLFIILGFNSIQREEKYSCDEVFFSISNGRIAKIISKLITLIIASIIINLLILATYYIFYIVSGMPAVFYKQAFAYIVLYYIIPFIIMGCIGMTIGLVANGKLAYIFIIFFWFLMGISNFVIFMPIINITKTEFDFGTVANFFNLAQTDPHWPFHVIYGLPLELTRWFHKGMILSVVITVLTLIILKKSRRMQVRDYVISTLIGGIVITSFFILYLRPSQVIYTIDEEKSVRKYDLKYYREHKNNFIPVEKDFIIQAYDINLSIKQTMDVDVDINLKSLNSIDKLRFTLYRDLKVTSVMMGDSILKYVQEGDTLTILLPGKIEADKSSRLHIRYSGTTSPMFFANEQAVMIPAYYSWLPREGEFQLMDAESGYSPNTPHEAKYKLNYRGRQPLHTNIPYKGNNVWEGTVPHGITLLASDNILSKNMGSYIIYYPAAFYKEENKISEIYKHIKEVNDNVDKDFQITSNDENSKHIFLLPQRHLSAANPETYSFGDHIIQETMRGSFYYNPVLAATKRALTILNANSVENTMENASYKPVADAYEYWYALRYKPEEIKNCNLSDDRVNRSGADLERSLKKFIDNNKDKPDLMRSFFYSAYDMLKSGDEEGFRNLLMR